MTTYYAYKVQLVIDKEGWYDKTVVSTNEGIQIGVIPDPDQEYVERMNPENGDVLWCNPDDYYQDSEGLLEFLAGEGIEGNPFLELT